MKVETLLADICRRQRRKKRLSQEKVAILAGIDRSYYSKIERGECKPTLIMLFKVCKALDLTLSEVVREIEGKASSR